MNNTEKQIDWLITILPLTLILLSSVLIFLMREQSNEVLS